MSKADTSKLAAERKRLRSAPSGAARADNEFAIHEHIGRHLKIMFDAVANEPIPEKLRQLLDELERKQKEESSAPSKADG
jgi:hypothetical protein